jgi:transcriptional repressor NrdR
VRCPFCKTVKEDQVVDSRMSDGGRVIRRRRKCRACKKRFTTYERIEDAINLQVVKRDGRHEAYDREKLVTSVERACTKLPISREQVHKLADEVEEEIFAGYDSQVPSTFIGERVEAKLRRLNQVAYVRFASIYRDFRDVKEFINAAQSALSAAVEGPGQQQLFESIPRLKRPPGAAPPPASATDRPATDRPGADRPPVAATTAAATGKK